MGKSWRRNYTRKSAGVKSRSSPELRTRATRVMRSYFFCLGSTRMFAIIP